MAGEDERGHEFARRLHSHWAREGTAGKPIVFRTELGDYVPLDIEDVSDATVVTLLEAGK